MKLKKTIIILIMLSVIIIGMNANNITQAENITEEKIYCSTTLEDEFTDNEILIVITNEESLKFSEYTVNCFSEINCIEVTDLTDGYEEKIEQQLNGTYEGNMPVKLETFNRILKLTLGFSSKEYVLSSIKELEKREDIKSAEPNYIVEKGLGHNIIGNNIPNDIKYYINSQWGIDAAKLPDAWNITTGSEDILVGIIDTGIDATHEDLAGKVDTTLSKSFSTSYPNPLVDEGGHGTHIAGIIGAKTDNEIGVAGVCWEVSIVSLKSLWYFDEEGKTIFKISWLIDAIEDADTNNIPILNFSIWNATNNNELFEAIENYSGLFVCIAGNAYNDNDLNPNYPSNYSKDLSNMISVGATQKIFTDSDLNQAIWIETVGGKTIGSNYGKTTVNIFAPGKNIMSTLPTSINSSGYDYWDGTSMAAPFVTGVAALILSINSDLSPQIVKNIILSSADKYSSFTNLCTTGGILNAYRAVLHATHYNTDKFNSSLHNITYVQEGILQHRLVCDCGYESLENHNWIRQSTVTNNNINAVPSIYVCTKCGITSLTNPNTTLSNYNEEDN